MATERGYKLIGPYEHRTGEFPTVIRLRKVVRDGDRTVRAEVIELAPGDEIRMEFTDVLVDRQRDIHSEVKSEVVYEVLEVIWDEE